VELPPIVDTAAKDVLMQCGSVRPAIRREIDGGRKGGEAGGGRCYPSKIRIEILTLHGKMADESVLDTAACHPTILTLVNVATLSRRGKRIRERSVVIQMGCPQPPGQVDQRVAYSKPAPRPRREQPIGFDRLRHCEIGGAAARIYSRPAYGLFKAYRSKVRLASQNQAADLKVRTNLPPGGDAIRL